MPRGDQLSRQWRLLQMIDRPQGVTVDDAARDLECTIRTIWRDLGVLQAAGFPIYTERAADGNRGVWRVTEGVQARAAAQAHPGRAGRAADEPRSADAARRQRAGPRGRLRPSTRSSARSAATRSRSSSRMRDRLGVRPAGAKAPGLPPPSTCEDPHRLAERRHPAHALLSASRDREDDRRQSILHLTLTTAGLYLVGHCHLS